MTIFESMTLILAAVAAGTPGVLAVISSRQNRGKLQELHVSLDGRLTQFFEAQKETLREIADANQKIGRMDEKRDHAALAVTPSPPPP
jgi:hypothetical protein